MLIVLNRIEPLFERFRQTVVRELYFLAEYYLNILIPVRYHAGGNVGVEQAGV